MATFLSAYNWPKTVVKGLITYLTKSKLKRPILEDISYAFSIMFLSFSASKSGPFEVDLLNTV